MLLPGLLNYEMFVSVISVQPILMSLLVQCETHTFQIQKTAHGWRNICTQWLLCCVQIFLIEVHNGSYSITVPTQHTLNYLQFITNATFHIHEQVVWYEAWHDWPKANNIISIISRESSTFILVSIGRISYTTNTFTVPISTVTDSRLSLYRFTYSSLTGMKINIYFLCVKIDENMTFKYKQINKFTQFHTKLKQESVCVCYCIFTIYVIENIFLFHNVNDGLWSQNQVWISRCCKSSVVFNKLRSRMSCWSAQLRLFAFSLI